MVILSTLQQKHTHNKRLELALVVAVMAVMMSPIGSAWAQTEAPNPRTQIHNTLRAWMSAYESVPTDQEIRGLGTASDVGETLAKFISDPDEDEVARARAISMSAAVGGTPVHNALRTVMANPNTSPLLKRKVALVVADVQLPEALTVLEQLANHPDVTVRESAMVGLGRLGTEGALAALEKRRSTESNPTVKKAADRAIITIRDRQTHPSKPRSP